MVQSNVFLILYQGLLEHTGVTNITKIQLALNY